MISNELAYIKHGLNQKILAITCTQNSKYSYNEITSKIGFQVESLAIPHQIHSANVLFVKSSGDFKNCDGLITNNENVVLSLQTADCTPIFLYDELTGMRGLVHAGWRGVVSGITNNAIRCMVEHGSIVEHINVFLGPSICMQCYQVGIEVASQFNSCSKINKIDDKWLVNIHEEIKYQLLDEGVISSQIESSSICTYENDDLCSYRRDGHKAGRMYSFLGVENGFI